MSKLWRSTSFCLLFLAIGLSSAADADRTVVRYEPTSEVLANPERGFYVPKDTQASRYVPVDPSDLRQARAQRAITLVYRGFYLDAFVEAPIDRAYLDSMQADFDAVREAGAKAIVRFAYTRSLHFAEGTRWPPLRPYGDATPSRVLQHLDQLEPLLMANADVIAVVQAGFVGIWGEWFYTDHFSGENLDEPTAENWQARREVVIRILKALPPTRMVQVRTPLQKQKIFATELPVPSDRAFDGSDLARVGHHNDCFLASDTDYGTYRDPESEYPYLAAETEFTPMGGETCSPNPPRSDCAEALAEMARFHWSYLNSGYHRKVLEGWRGGGCMAEVDRRLGYRLALTSGEFEDRARSGERLRLRLQIRNEGFAAPYLPRGVELVLRHTDSGEEYFAELDEDPRLWLAGQTQDLDCDLGIPADVPAGRYDLLLHLPDPEPRLHGRPEYAIRLANRDTWEEETGYNRLFRGMTVSGNSDPGAPLSGPLFRTISAIEARAREKAPSDTD